MLVDRDGTVDGDEERVRCRPLVNDAARAEQVELLPVDPGDPSASEVPAPSMLVAPPPRDELAFTPEKPRS